ncbi:ABC transporter ATP-binding protein [Gottschalkia acidurici 9a]|uniref:ABC transporter ATP-binding protein n=1 Tax=Gottschalkia acidurici (strain ATCC 7906 / DSM 604 / BCRC 14475 / CIP 104303 / KCTC 5404 / NCIMB 10678 / 9a) TaxID=1128398 RepID=K0AWJ7_GOTA9|nr:ATP-binding cassette domain-containing protein [Gottschalkia acidurici]AFS77137.1 ABC transporter ATP-binding protein [Gottschalkia acidurici 9a]
MVLHIRGLGKKYGNYLAVNNIDIDFTPGIWGLLGPNGAGKTTLMKMMVGLLNPTGGEILYNDAKVQDLGDIYRDKIGYLPQDFGYYENLSIIEYLEYISVLKGLDKKTIQEKIEYLLNMVQLLDAKYKKMKELSHGMRQRVGIAMALLNDPDILILDEPTAGLDMDERRSFRKYISEFARNRIVIISTHIASDIEFISNRIAMVNKGKLIVNETTSKLVDRLNNMVWEVIISEEDFSYWEEKVNIINFRNESENRMHIRFISKDPIDGGKLVKTELNDVYLDMIERIHGDSYDIYK